MWQQLIQNHMLLSGLIACLLAQFLKIPFEYLREHRLNWAMFFSTGGMPSSHSALMVATTLAIGLHTGFDTPAFAIAVAITLIVVYDAAGVRRQAGMHAQKINQLIEELLSGKPISEERLKEVLGHTPREVTGGVLLGLITALVYWWIAG